MVNNVSIGTSTCSGGFLKLTLNMSFYRFVCGTGVVVTVVTLTAIIFVIKRKE